MKPGRVAQMTALDVAGRTRAKPHQHIAAEAFDQRHSFSRIRFGERAQGTTNRAGRKAIDELLDKRQRLLDLAHPNPDPSVDVAVIAHRHLELQNIVRRVRDCSSRIEGAATGATDIAPAGELPRQRGR